MTRVLLIHVSANPGKIPPAIIALLIIIGVLLVVSLVLYAISAVRSARERKQGKLPVERKGTGLLGGFINMGRPGGGISTGCNPGAFMLYGRKDENEIPNEDEEPDPRKR